MNSETLSKLRGLCRDEAAFNQLTQVLSNEFRPLRQEINQAQLEVEQQKALFRVVTRLREPLDLDTIFKATAIEVRQLLSVDRVGIFRFYPDSGWDDGEFVSEDVDPAYPSAMAQKVHDHCFGDQFAIHYQQGRVQAVADIHHAGLSDCHIRILSQFHIQANLIVPLLQGQNLWGLLCIHQCRSPRPWQPLEIEFVNQIANHLGVALKHAELLADLRAEIIDRQQAEARERALNQGLRQAIVELKAVNKELETFSYSVSHDLRAPLRSIDGFSQALLEDCHDQLDESGQNYLHRIRLATQRMGQLIDDLLTLAQVTRIDMALAPVDLSRLASRIGTHLQQTHLDHPVELIVQPDLSAQGDPHLLQVVLENLLNNAWKFTSKRAQAQIEFGCIPPNTDIPGTPESSTVPTYFVRDNGVGFDMAYVGKLFGAFQRLHGVQDFPGTGIGLATVQRIVHRHGGRVWVIAAVDQGATFYFTLEEETTEVRA
jgi:light-regulated signal transduction histidine kinase (bacteriophytochrome)